MQRRSILPSILLAGIIITALVVGAFILFNDTDAPAIVLSPQVDRISPALPLTLTIADNKNPVKKVSIVAKRNDRTMPILEKTFDDKALTQQVAFSLKEMGVKDGSVNLEITVSDSSFARFGAGNRETYVIPLTIDTTPPRITIKTSPPNIRRGGSAVILYTVSKEVAQTGVRVKDLFFPGFRQENGDFLCFFAYPHTMTNQTFAPEVVAVDRAGNAQVTALPVTKIHREFRHDTIAISQNLLDSKGAEFEQIVPGDMQPIERFLKVNGDVRKSNAATLMEIGRNTSPEILWSGPFMALPRGATRAGFADHRIYTWHGEKVDEQTHLGYDLASTAQAPVPAANTGKVIFTGYLGIYGNLIVIDHGLGLQSLYSHLTTIGVAKDQAVQKGDIIGHTGNTGMAVGDHLHFGILIAGLEVAPLEWLDDHWIQDNVISRVRDAGGTAPQFALPAEKAAAPAAAAKKAVETKKPAKGKAPEKTPQRNAKKPAAQPAKKPR